MEKTKYYGKNVYKTEKKIKTAFIILIIFLLGLYIGLAINYLELQDKDKQIREYQVEIDSLKESIHLLEKEKLYINK